MSSSKGVSLSSSSALKIQIIFLSKRSKSLKRENFDIRQRKFKNNTDVYLQDFLRYYAKFTFLNHIGLGYLMPQYAERRSLLIARKNNSVKNQFFDFSTSYKPNYTFIFVMICAFSFFLAFRSFLTSPF